VAEVVEADGAQPNMKEQRLEGPLVYVGHVKYAYQSLWRI
jgi:hypothetical protein